MIGYGANNLFNELSLSRRELLTYIEIRLILKQRSEEPHQESVVVQTSSAARIDNKPGFRRGFGSLSPTTTMISPSSSPLGWDATTILSFDALPNML